MQNLGTLQQLSLGDLADDGKRREERERREEKIMPRLMATLLHWRTHSARTNRNIIPSLESQTIEDFGHKMALHRVDVEHLRSVFMAVENGDIGML
jgi:hypothetical protein